MGTINKVIAIASMMAAIGSNANPNSFKSLGLNPSTQKSMFKHTKGKRHLSLRSRSNRRKAQLKH